MSFLMVTLLIGLARARARPCPSSATSFDALRFFRSTCSHVRSISESVTPSRCGLRTENLCR
jgi:hypothetical protein